MPALDAPKTPPYKDFSVSVASVGSELVVAPSGELDSASAHLVEREVRRHCGSGCNSVVIDLRAVVFLDSRGLSALIGLRNDAKRNHHRLSLVPGPAGVERIFRVTATRGLFDWREPE